MLDSLVQALESIRKAIVSALFLEVFLIELNELLFHGFFLHLDFVALDLLVFENVFSLFGLLARSLSFLVEKGQVDLALLSSLLEAVHELVKVLIFSTNLVFDGLVDLLILRSTLVNGCLDLLLLLAHL